MTILRKIAYAVMQKVKVSQHNHIELVGYYVCIIMIISMT